LIAEKRSGGGEVLGMTFDLNQLRGMRDRDLFVRKVITYLLTVSRLG
jgi:hypothetical protein